MTILIKLNLLLIGIYEDLFVNGVIDAKSVAVNAINRASIVIKGVNNAVNGTIIVINDKSELIQ